MPAVLRIGGLRVVIYPNDHRPPHVHVIGAGTEAIFNLNCPDGPPALRGSFGFTTAELNRILSALAASLAALCEQWSVFMAITDDDRVAAEARMQAERGATPEPSGPATIAGCRGS